MMPRPRQAGFALVAALGLLAVLSVAAILHWQAEESARQRLWLATEEARAVARLEAGAASVLAERVRTALTAAASPTASPTAIPTAGSAAGTAAGTAAGSGGGSGGGPDAGTALARDFSDGARLVCQTRDLAARLNVNALLDRRGEIGPVQRAAFSALFASVGIEAGAVDALADRLDADDEARLPWGAETAWYRAHRPGQVHRNGPMNSLEELADIRGFPPQASARLAPWLTALPAAAGLNVNSVEPELLGRIDAAFSRARLAELVAARPFADLSAWRSWAARADAPVLPGLIETRSAHHAVDCHYSSAGARLGERLKIETHKDGRIDFLGRSRLPTEGR